MRTRHIGIGKLVSAKDSASVVGSGSGPAAASALAKTIRAGVLSLTAATLVAGCSSADDAADAGDDAAGSNAPAPTETAATATTTAPPSGEDKASESPSPTSSAAESSQASAAASSSARAGDMPEDVAEAYAAFHTLAPKSLFEDFESCEAGGMQGSYNCTGPKAGQWQLSDSTAKAAQSTQVLTELRSSKVVEDKGSRVVGWSTLGSTAIITLVDNDEGLVMQQMTSLDQEDPEKRLQELDLIKADK